jgi:hypothetical protein
MPKLRSSLATLAITAGLASLLGAGLRPAAADWLVTREGARLETRGPWQEKGKLVVFQGTDGKLASLRLSDVDLAASRQATAEATEAERARTEAAAAPAAPVPKRKSVASITDKDVAHPAPAAGAETEDPAKDAKKDAAAEPPKDRKADLSVTDWKRSEAGADGHVLITGTVHNDSGATVTDVRLGVQLFDETGKLLADVPAVLTATALLANQQAGFRAEATDLFTFATAKFEPLGVRMAVRPDGPPESSKER